MMDLEQATKAVQARYPGERVENDGDDTISVWIPYSTDPWLVFTVADAVEYVAAVDADLLAGA